MKITKARLKEIINEELERVAEAGRPLGLGLDYDPNVRVPAPLEITSSVPLAEVILTL